MVGGEAELVEQLVPAFDAVRPPANVGTRSSTPVRSVPGNAKMVHRGIEYGLMLAYAESYELLAGGS